MYFTNFFIFSFSEKQQRTLDISDNCAFISSIVAPLKIVTVSYEPILDGFNSNILSNIFNNSSLAS